MSLFRLWCVPDNSPDKPDCFLVLSYAVEDTENPTLPTGTIIRLANEWRKKFPGSKIIMSTGDNQGLGVTNSRVMCKYASGLGIPRKHLIEEDKSYDTYTNLICSRKIIDKYKFRKVCLVLYDLHVRRTLAVAKKLGWENFFWVSAGSAGSPAYGIKKFQTFSRLSIFIYELMAYVYNKLKGEI